MEKEKNALLKAIVGIVKQMDLDQLRALYIYLSHWKR